MPSPIVLKLSHGSDLTEEDRAELEALSLDKREVGARQDLIREGERPEYVQVVLQGFACRYKLLADGSRQIMALLTAGDFCDLRISILDEMDHSIGTLSPCVIARLSKQKVEELSAGSRSLNRALWWATLVDEAILREWLVSMGRRSADKQMAHLFCELLVRLDGVGLVENNCYDLPLSQADLSDVLGLTPIHVNRTLQKLRVDGLIQFASKRMCIPDVPTLMEFAEFDGKYLHRRKRGEAT